jgi:hypothetical protein
VKRVSITALILLAVLGGLATKLVFKQIEFSHQSERFGSYVEAMPERARPFIIQEFKEIHPDAFRDAYSLWVWWPLDELRLSANFDQRRYFRQVHDHIVGTATREGETRAIPAISSLAPFYGIPTTPTAPAEPPRPSASETLSEATGAPN